MAATNTSSQYVEQTAGLLGLKIPPEYLSGVKENFAAIARIAALVTEFDLPHS